MIRRFQFGGLVCFRLHHTDGWLLVSRRACADFACPAAIKLFPSGYAGHIRQMALKKQVCHLSDSPCLFYTYTF